MSKNFLNAKTLGFLLSGQCLWFQGCLSFDRQSNSSDLSQQSTLISCPSCAQNTSHNAGERTVVSQHVRALPRRPISSIIDDYKYEEEPSEQDALIQEENTYYIVRKGDSLWSIGRKHHVNWKRIMQANQLSEKSILREGQRLVIPSSSTQNVPASPSNTVEYTVQKGDTLSGISQRYHTSVGEIQRQNHLSSHRIYVGQKLKLNGLSSTPAQGKSLASIQGDKYTVQAGDTLSDIATRSGMKLDELIRINRITNPRALQVGQVINLNRNQQSTIVPIQAETTTLQAKDVKDMTAPDTTIISNEGSNESDGEQHEMSDDQDFEDLFEEENNIPVMPLEEHEGK